MNSKRRVIFKSERGAFFVKQGPKKLYDVKATFKKVGSGSPKVLTAAMSNTVPLALRKLTRTAPRGPREGAMLRKMNTESRKMRGVVSPGGTRYKTKREMNMMAFLRRMTQNSPAK
jgi:hypothetical protein